MSSHSTHDELTAAVLSAVLTLSPQRKANFLLENALALLQDGKYGDSVENYFDVYLKTPGLPNDDVAKALLARANARKIAAERLLAKAQLDYQTVSRIDPPNRELKTFLHRGAMIHFVSEPASHRAPPEIWERIARFIPRHHLRTWLFVSAFHRNIAVRSIFHTVDLYFGEDQDNPKENLNRGLDIFERVKTDADFNSAIKVLRLHWASPENDLFDLLTRILRTSLPAFKSLHSFEWIGYPELRTGMVQTLLSTYPTLRSLGLIGWHFDAIGVSNFSHLRQFTLRAEDDDGDADMSEVRSVLDRNSQHLRRLTLGAYLQRQHSWDAVFESVAIRGLQRLDLVDSKISQVVLSRMVGAVGLRELTIHGTFELPMAASVVFGSDHIISGGFEGDEIKQQHTLLPNLESFRFVTVGHDDDLPLFQSVISFLKGRTNLKRLDLGNCPWELVAGVLGGLKALRVLRVRIVNLTQRLVEDLVKVLPREMVGIHLGVVVSDKPLNTYAPLFSRFQSLSILHLHGQNHHRPQASSLSEKDFQVQTDLWTSAARSLAEAVPSVDFVGWHGEHYVVVRSVTGSGAVAGSSSSSEGGSGSGGSVELKELPARRRLDCGKGVDLGGEDGAWLERKDVPMDYEISGLET